mgnify:CR=1 FL=1
MKKILLLIVILVGFNSLIFAQMKCVESAKIVKPALTPEAKLLFETKLDEATVNLAAEKVRTAAGREKSDDPAATLIWVGRRWGYLGEYKKAIEQFTQGTKTYPKDARFYRHRGHRLISIRCLDDAIKDFKRAAKLIKGKQDVVEPDGLPNVRNMPTSTLQSNIWYHLGLAYYLKGDFKNAAKAYKKGLLVSKNPDMLVAMTNWRYISVRRWRGEKAAEKELKRIKDDLDIIENEAYYKLVKVYQGKLDADDLLKEIRSDANSLSNASLGYGLGNWFLMNGEKEKAMSVFRQITTGDQWASFGFIAAEAELKRDSLK